MPAELAAVCFDALEPEVVGRFWAEVLGWERDAGDVALLRRPDDSGFAIRFVRTETPKTVQNHVHLDLTSTSVDDQRRTVERVLSLGARHVDIGQREDEPHVVLADPEGNEFCVLEPGNRFVAGTGFLGCVVCDGSQAVGYFWSAALGWHLVWDHDEETAIQSPQGGPKISWGGTAPAAPTLARRAHFELVPGEGADQQAEADRLISLGATPLHAPSHDPGALHLADPDGNEFCVVPT